MFDIAWSELLIIGIVALIVIGPKELPATLRTLGQWMGKVRRMAAEFQGQFHEAMREAELEQLKKDMDEMASKAQSYTHFDPIAEMGNEVEKSIGDLPALDQPAAPDVATAPPAPDTPAAALPEPASGGATNGTATAAAAAPAPAAVTEATVSEARGTEAGVTEAKPEAGRAPA